MIVNSICDSIHPGIRRAKKRASRGTLPRDPGIETSIKGAMSWLKKAQDCSVSHDNGFARHYHLRKGWGSSYPETTGYIIPTLLAEARITGCNDIFDRCKKALDWLVSIQCVNGGFPGGTATTEGSTPTVFNTGQILLGLAEGYRIFEDNTYLNSLRNAANWLVDIQELDGCWIQYNSPFARKGFKTYQTHVAWGLLEAAAVTGDKSYADAAYSNIEWAISQQNGAGWFENCCLSDPGRPLTHTIGYALRGILEAYLHSRRNIYLETAILTGNALLNAMKPNGQIPGRLDREWKPQVEWSCLTGMAQISICWLMLYEYTSDKKWLEAARTTNRFLRQTQWWSEVEGINGGISGSYPIDGEYGKYQILNWACKFFIDAIRKESKY